jgi:hypothetical protein
MVAAGAELGGADMAVALRRAKEGQQEDWRKNIGTEIICETNM